MPSGLVGQLVSDILYDSTTTIGYFGMFVLVYQTVWSDCIVIIIPQTLKATSFIPQYVNVFKPQVKNAKQAVKMNINKAEDEATQSFYYSMCYAIFFGFVVSSVVVAIIDVFF